MKWSTSAYFTARRREQPKSVGKKGTSKGPKPVRPTLSRQLWNDLDHLIDVDKLYPSLQILGVIIPYKLGLLGAPKEGARALIRLLNDGPAPLDPELGLEHPEFPALERVVVPACTLVGDIEFETRPIEPAGLADGFDVGCFKREKDA